MGDLNYADAGTQRPLDNNKAELNRRYLHGSPSYELYGLDEKGARPKVRANIFGKICLHCGIRIEIRSSTPGVHFTSPETQTTSTPTRN